MRLILFLNNWGGWQVAKWLRARGEDIAAVVVQPESDQRFAPEIRRELGLPANRVYLGPQLRTSETLAQLRDLGPELGISAWFGYILKPELLDLFPRGCINLHPAYLPWNRGWHTNVWPILDGSPAGVTVHYIDPGVDTGDVIAQRQVVVGPTDTGGSLHQKLTLELIDLFQSTFPSIRDGQASRTPQNHALATTHRKSELAAVDRIDLDRNYRSGDFLNLLRARTYPPYPAAFFLENGQKVYVRAEFVEDAPAFAASGKSPRIDLDRELPARELLSVLGPGKAPETAGAHFLHEARPIGVRARYLREEDLAPGENPPWMKAPVG